MIIFRGNIEKIQLVRELKEKGMTFEEIGRQLGITRQRASAIFRSDMQAPSITKWNLYYKTFAEEYNNGLTSQKIAEKYNCSLYTVLKALKKEGITANKRRGRKPAGEVISTP